MIVLKPLQVNDDLQRDVHPEVLIVDGHRVEVLGVDDRWFDPAANYVKVAASDGRIYLLRCDSENRHWSAIGVWELDA